MNTYKKFCPNVFIAQCEEEYQKGDIIQVCTKYGKENDHIVHNLVAKKDNLFFYSITRYDGFNNQIRASNRAEKLQNYSLNATKRAHDWIEKSNEGKSFLSLAEPIKIGHHSEKKHRALIERNWTRMSNAMEEFKKAESYSNRIEYWEKLAQKIDLSMPESIEFFKEQLDESIIYQKGLKNGTYPRLHSFSLTYATKRVKDLESKYNLALKLWS